MKDYIEKNIMIAKFMGWKQGDFYNDERFKEYWFDANGVAKSNSSKLLFFDCSWSELMPVVRKIVEICCADANGELFMSDEYTSVLDTVSCAVIEDTYKVVVEFIEFYNNFILEN